MAYVSNSQNPVKRERADCEIEGLGERLAVERYDPSLPLNPPPDKKWKAKAAIHSLNLNGAEVGVLWCLLDCANDRTGLCYPGQLYIAGLLDIAPQKVNRAIAKLKRRKLITIIRGGRGKSNRYYINWPMLFDAFSRMEAFRTKRSKVMNQNPDDSSNLTILIHQK